MIDVNFQNGVYELALGRPPCNEIGAEMISALESSLDQVDLKSGRALIIYSALAKGFCAGADLRELYAGMIERPANEHQPLVKAFLDRAHRVMNRLDTLPLTTIGVINGVCFGGGFELALTCDLLIADRTARFGFPELRLGLIPAFGGIPRLKREMPNGVIRDLVLTGRSINAKRAFDLGLVSQLVAPGAALNVARATARQITLFDAETSRTAKAFIKPLPEAELEQEKELFLRLFQNPAVKEALNRFVSSRDPMPYLPQGMQESR